MGKASRLRKERSQVIAFLDVDYVRGSRPWGNSVPEAPPEAFLPERAGIVRMSWDGNELTKRSDELIEGPEMASQLVDVLGKEKLIVGHGILTSDLRSVAMLTPIPERVIRRCLDTLAFAHRARGGRYPTGCGLSTLAHLNSTHQRTKPSYPSSVPGLRPGGFEPRPRRGGHDPREDALVVAELWACLVRNRTIAWGEGRPGWRSVQGNTWPASPSGRADLSTSQIAELTGTVRQMEAIEWQERLKYGGHIMTPTHTDGDAMILSGLNAEMIPSTSAIEALIVHLINNNEIPSDFCRTKEGCLRIVQRLGAKQNIDVRTRLISGRPFTKVLRETLAWHIWWLGNPEWTSAFLERRQLANTTAYGAMRWGNVGSEREEIRSRIHALVAQPVG